MRPRWHHHQGRQPLTAAPCGGFLPFGPGEIYLRALGLGAGRRRRVRAHPLSPTGAMEVDALYSETMRDVVALEAAAGSGGSSLSSSIWVSAVAVMQIDNNWLRCSVCSLNLLNLKPPVFQCKSGHLACETCRAGWCQKCKHGGGRFDAQNTVVEHIISASKFKCPHRGCHGFFTYREVTAHNDACPHAPCSCAEPGCGFASPPHALLRHLTSLHSWPAYGIQYGKALWLRVPASGPCRQLILAEDDGRVFVLVVGALRAVTAVSLVCVPTARGRRAWLRAARAWWPWRR